VAASASGSAWQRSQAAANDGEHSGGEGKRWREMVVGSFRELVLWGSF